MFRTKKLILVYKSKNSLPDNRKNHNNSGGEALGWRPAVGSLAVIHDAYHFLLTPGSRACTVALCARTAWFSLASSAPRACAYPPLYIIGAYSRASRVVSGLPGPGPSSFFVFLLFF